MLSIFIMLFIAIGVAVGVGFTVVTLLQTAHSSLSVLTNQVRIHNIANSIRAATKVDGDRLLLPVRSDLTTRPPDVAPFSTTTSGGQIVYCPFLKAAEATTPVMKTKKEGEEDEPLEVFAVTTATVSGATYVTAGHAEGLDGVVAYEDSDGNPVYLTDRMSQLGLIGYLISPQPNSTAPLRCGDVRLAPDRHTLIADVVDEEGEIVGAGTVVPIYGITADFRGAVFTLSEEEIGEFSNNDASRVVSSLADVAEFAERFDLPDVTVELPAEVGLEDFRTLASAMAGRTLRVRANRSGSEAVATCAPGPGTGGDVIAFKSEAMPVSRETRLVFSGRIEFDDVAICGVDESGAEMDVILDAGPGGSVLLDGGGAQAVRSSGGEVVAVDASIIPIYGDEATVTPVKAHAGRITLKNTIIGTEVADPVLVAEEGDIVLHPDVRVDKAPTAVLQDITGEGRISVANVPGTDGKIGVDEGAGEARQAVTDESKFTRVEWTCADGAASCSVACDADRVVTGGGCRSDSGSAVTASYPDDEDNSFKCLFSNSPVTQAPVAMAICAR